MTADTNARAHDTDRSQNQTQWPVLTPEGHRQGVQRYESHSCPHTHTHVRTHTHSYPHAHAHTHSPALIPVYRHTHTHTHVRTHPCAHTHTRPYSPLTYLCAKQTHLCTHRHPPPTLTHSDLHTHLCTYTHPLTSTHPCAYTLTRTLRLTYAENCFGRTSIAYHGEDFNSL